MKYHREEEEVSMSQLLDKLRLWGADVDGGMERMYADDEFYTKCLRMFESDENFGKLDIAFQTKNYEDAFSATHTLKGVAGNLSLNPLYKSLCTLTEKLRAHDYTNLDPLYQDVKQKEHEFKDMMKNAD
jgi:HPt (histidine-containing phosphotransfer) domain-containing protein